MHEETFEEIVKTRKRKMKLLFVRGDAGKAPPAEPIAWDASIAYKRYKPMIISAHLTTA